ncbi:GAF domain-containing protein (plasmid) [Deinococcus sp. KNUC1210]|uniref:GAF domain-containing protein n=1 Tax=Deinococcus sp. KNUC1210 TaxID=2917691 RepID=UPI001EEFDF67|nr:GAF domain-containing protein [Deinococcus sp. KNUC1210]ULH17504.1 GAF domain-containing protein [Deinococcus sp. KNUC1210]
MSESSALGTPATLALSEQLQQMMQTLAATPGQEDVLQTVLESAVRAVQASAGTVLLGAADGTLVVACTQGSRAPGVWPDGAPDRSGFVGDALARRQPLYFGHPGELVAAVPALAGAAVPVACAVVPMVLDGQPLGSIVIEFDHAHEFTPAEQRFLQTVAAQCSVALGRARLLMQRRQQILADGALNAFIRFTEAAADTTEFTVLVSRAAEVLRATIGDVSVAYYELHQGIWRARALSDDLSPEHLQLIHAGFPENTPRFANAVRARQPIFVSGWQPVEAGFPAEPRYGALASYPYLPEASFPRLLSVGAKNKASWSDQEQAILRAVGRTLGLALERAIQTQQLQEERAGLDAFVTFAEAAGTNTDTLALIQQASTVLRATLEQVSVAYYELEDGLWKARVWTDDVPPEVVRDIQAGIPQDAPNFLEAAQSDAAVFVDGWKAEENHVSSATVYGAVALLHIATGERPRLFTLGTVHARAWTERERASVRAVGRSLTLALERADLSAQLEKRTRQIEEGARAQEAFVAFTEAVGSETDVLTLARQAIQVMQAQLPEVGVVYYQLEAQVWTGAVWSDDIPPERAEQLRLGVPADSTHFAQAIQTGTAVFANRGDAHAGQSAHAALNGAAAFVPLIVDGQAHALFAVGKHTGTHWTMREQGIIRALGRSLGLALERTEHARQLQLQKAVVESRNQALEAFARLTRDIANETDRYALIQRAQELVLLCCRRAIRCTGNEQTTAGS